MSTEKQLCKSCGRLLPMARDYFGNTPNGNYRKKCRTCMAAHTATYNINNPDAAIERAAIRKSREAEAGGMGYDSGDVYQILRAVQHRCAYCDESLASGYHIDHVVPVARGGPTSPENLTACCVKCNLAKHAKTAAEYYEWRKSRGLSVRNPRVV